MAIKTVSVTFEDSTRRKYVRKTAIRYGVHCFGFALSFGSYGAVIFLQSSMNITGSLGKISFSFHSFSIISLKFQVYVCSENNLRFRIQFSSLKVVC